MRLLLPVLLRAQLEQAALQTFPRECCGLIEGVRAGTIFRATALHAAANLAKASNRFELDPAAHVVALKLARARGHVLIGCYHSHPDDKAAPSQADLSGAAEEDFLWLIAATDGTGCQLGAFLYRGARFEGVAISALGADFVTSSLNERR